MTIKQRKRKSGNRELVRAKEASVSTGRITVYINQNHIDELRLIALKQRSNASEIVNQIITEWFDKR